MTGLAELDLQYVAGAGPLSDDSIVALTGLYNLRWLSLSSNGTSRTMTVTDAGLSALLQSLPRLQILSISPCESFTNAVLLMVGQRCRELTELDMRGSWDLSNWYQSALVPLFQRLTIFTLGYATICSHEK